MSTLDMPGLPVPNLPLLRKILDHIDAHPETWDQGHMGGPTALECGTPMCVAGWAIALTGEHEDWYSGEAAKVLGLTPDEAEDMFFTTICPGDLGLPHYDVRGAVQLVAERIAVRAGERL